MKYTFKEQIGSDVVWSGREEDWEFVDFVFSMSFRGCVSYISAAYYCSSVGCYFFQLSLNYCIKLIDCFAELTDPGLKKQKNPNT